MPTIRQKIAASKISENIRNGDKKPLGKILRESGYSKSVSESPQRVTGSKGWQELMEDYFPDSKVAQVHSEALEAKKTQFYNKKKYETPDYDVRLRALDLIYKLKQKYKEKPVEVRLFSGWTPKELEAYATAGIVPERFANAS